MFSIAYDIERLRSKQDRVDFRKLRIAQIMDQLNQVAGSRDLMDCAPSIRTLIEEDVPLLVELLDEQR